MTIDEAIREHKAVAREQRKRASEPYELYPNICRKCAEEHEQLVEWLEELKALKDEKQYWDMQNNKAYEQGRADAINAIKNDLRGKLVEEQNKPYPDGSLCLGYYNSIKICDWYLNDNKECEE